MNENQTPVIWTVVIASLVILVALFIAVSSVNSNLALNTQALSNINMPTTEAVVSGVLAGIVIPEIVQPEFPDYMLSEEDYEENLMEAEAEDLATEYLEDKNFLEELVTYLEDEMDPWFDRFEGLDEDDLSIEILDVDVDGTSTPYQYEVTFDIKVYEDDDKIAKVEKVVITVNYVDYDDDFEDAEAVEDAVFTDLTPRVY